MLSKLKTRLRALLRKSKMERELDEEVAIPHRTTDRAEHPPGDGSGRGASTTLARLSAEWSRRRRGAATLAA